MGSNTLVYISLIPQVESRKPLMTLRLGFPRNTLWLHDFDRCTFISIFITVVKKAFETKRASLVETEDTWSPSSGGPDLIRKRPEREFRIFSMSVGEAAKLIGAHLTLHSGLKEMRGESETRCGFSKEERQYATTQRRPSEYIRIVRTCHQLPKIIENV